MVFIIENGVPRELTPEEAEALAASTMPDAAGQMNLRLSEVEAKLSDILSAGYAVSVPGAELHIQADPESIANVRAMGAAAADALDERLPFPDAYSSWRPTENEPRIPIPSATFGFRLAASVSNWEVACRQWAAVLKDAIRASEDPASVDIENGWPVANFSAQAVQAFENYQAMLARRLEQEEA